MRGHGLQGPTGSWSGHCEMCQISGVNMNVCVGCNYAICHECYCKKVFRILIREGGMGGGTKEASQCKPRSSSILDTYWMLLDVFGVTGSSWAFAECCWIFRICWMPCHCWMLFLVNTDAFPHQNRHEEPMPHHDESCPGVMVNYSLPQLRIHCLTSDLG